MQTSVEKDGNEILTPLQRWTGLATVVAMLLVLGFFAFHQLAGTGFFVATFGSWEMVCLYGPILVSFAAPIIRALSGRKNPARPFEVATNLSLALGSLWLVIVFPFNFSHLADVLPDAIRFIFSWITNDIGKAVLILQVIIGTVAALLTTFKYLSVRR